MAGPFPRHVRNFEIVSPHSPNWKPLDQINAISGRLRENNTSNGLAAT
jgi:hypothetical protein